MPTRYCIIRVNVLAQPACVRVLCTTTLKTSFTSAVVIGNFTATEWCVFREIGSAIYTVIIELLNVQNLINQQINIVCACYTDNTK